MSEELKPCPICSGKMIFREEVGPSGMPLIYAMCVHACVRTFGKHKTEHVYAAIALAWNTRTPPAPPEPVGEKVREEMSKEQFIKLIETEILSDEWGEISQNEQASVMRSHIESFWPHPQPATTGERVENWPEWKKQCMEIAVNAHREQPATTAERKEAYQAWLGIEDAARRFMPELKPTAISEVLRHADKIRAALLGQAAQRTEEMVDLLTSVTITREGPDKVCRKPISEEAAKYAIRALVAAGLLQAKE